MDFSHWEGESKLKPRANIIENKIQTSTSHITPQKGPRYQPCH